MVVRKSVDVGARKHLTVVSGVENAIREVLNVLFQASAYNTSSRWYLYKDLPSKSKLAGRCDLSSPNKVHFGIRLSSPRAINEII